MYSNKHLVEVNCGFGFPEETTPWDSTFFGQLYDKVKEFGFTEKQERKGVQITFNPTKNNTLDPITSSTMEDQVIFKNINTGRAILIGKNRVSFHAIKDYTYWDDFRDNFIAKFFNIYTELGLGNGRRECNIVYLNRFIKPSTENLASYFHFVSVIDNQFGVEKNTIVQRVLSNDKTLLIAKLNSTLTNTGYNINLECGAICQSIACKTGDWISQVNQTHEPIRNFFESLITEKLRQIL